MLKKLIQKLGVLNPEIEAPRVIEMFQTHMPAWRWRTVSDKGDTFYIEGTKRWHRLSINRDKAGYICATHSGRIRWELLTLGVGWLIAELRKHTHQGRARTLLKQHVEIGGTHGNG